MTLYTTPTRSLTLAALLIAALAIGCSDDSSSGGDGSTSNATSNATTSNATTGGGTTAEDTGVEADTSDPADTEVEQDSSPEDTGADQDTEADVPEMQPENPRELQAAAEGPLQAGIGVVLLDRPVGISMAGFGARFGPVSPWSDQLKASQGFYGHMTVKAMVFEVAGERLVMIKIPTMSSEHGMTDALVETLKERYELDLEGRIMTGATHSHHTHARYWLLPESLGLIGADSPDEEVIELLVSAFAEAIKAAVDDLAPAEWAFGYQDDWDPQDEVYSDRRPENDPLYTKDPRLSLLAVRRPGGAPMATIINFGMHGTTLSDDNDMLTEDSAGGIEMKFEEHFFAEEGQPIVGMFIQSGGGDAAPSGGQLGHPRITRTELLGEVAAPRILALYRSLEWSEEATLSVKSRRIDLRYDRIGYADSDAFLNRDGEPYTWGGMQCVGAEGGDNTEGQAMLCLDLESTLMSLGEPIPHGELHQTYLTVARIGNVFAVSLPGEPTYSVIKYLRERIKERATEDQPLEALGFGYSQDHLLYLTHPDDFYTGGFESQGGMWGPLFGQYLVERQMEFVDDMLEGYNAPSFYEESEALSKRSGEFEPRAFETSVEPGVVREDTQGAYVRTDQVRFVFSGGDPSISAPRVVVQAADGEGGFADVPSPSGWPGAAYDNSRYQMLTIYTPDPPPSRQVLEERRHDWSIQWEIPIDFPAGTYRLQATGQAWDGTEAKDWSVTSATFTITQSTQATLELSRGDDRLVATLSLPPVPYSEVDGTSWPQRGWRLLDATRRPTERPLVRAPLLVNLISGDSTLNESPLQARFDATAGGHVVDLTEVTLPDGPVTVRAWQANDRTASSLDVELTAQ